MSSPPYPDMNNTGSLGYFSAMASASCRQLADAIAEKYPKLPVLFMSGYGGDDILRRGLMVADAPFVQKPFTLEDLARSVRNRLDQATAET